MAALLIAIVFAIQPSHAVPPGNPDGNATWSPGQPAPGQTVTFVISAQDTDGVIQSVVLDYGDGTRDTVVGSHTATQSALACLFGDTFYGQLRHVYARAATYNATLTVTSGGCPLFGTLETQTFSRTLPVQVRAATAAQEGGPAPADTPDTAILSS